LDLYYAVLHSIRSVVPISGNLALLRRDPYKDALETVAVLSGVPLRRPPKVSELPSLDFDHAWTLLGASIQQGDPFDQTAFLVDDRGITQLRVPSPDPAQVSFVAEPREHIALTSIVQLQDALKGAVSFLANHAVIPSGSILCFPVHEGRDFLGALFVSDDHRDAFTARDIVLVREAATHLVQPLAQAARLESDLKLAESVAQEGTEPSSPAGNVPLRAVLSLLCERLRGLLRAASVVIIPYDAKSDRIDTANTAQSYGAPMEPGRQSPRKESLVRRTLEESRVEWIEGTAPSTFLPDSFVSRNQIKALYSLCLYREATLPDDRRLSAAIGVLIVNWRHTPKGDRGIAAADRRQAEDLAATAEHLMSVQETLLRARIARRRMSDIYNGALSLLARALSTGGRNGGLENVERLVLETVLDAALATVGGTAGLFARPSADHAGLDVGAARRHPPDVRSRRISIEFDEYPQGVTGACAVSRTPIVIPDSAEPETWPSGVQPMRWVERARSEIAVPVVDANFPKLLLGVIDVENELVDHAFDQTDVQVLEEIAHAASLALGVIRDVGQLQSIAVLAHKIDQAQLQNEDRVFQDALTEAQKVTGAFSVSARQIDRQGEHLLPTYHYGGPGEYDDKPLRLSVGVNGYAFRVNYPISLPDVWDKTTWPRLPGLEYVGSRPETRSEVAARISWRRDAIGVVNLEHRHPFALTPYEDYIKTVALYIGHALYQRRDQEERLRAKSQSLLEVMDALRVRLSHDVSGTLRTVADRLTTLSAEGDWDERTATLTELRDLTRTALDTAEGFLMMAVSDAHDEHHGYVDVDSLLAQAIAEFAASLRDEGVALSYTPTGQAHRVDCSAEALRWIVRAILSNSIRSKSTEVAVRVEATSRSGVAILFDNDGEPLSREEMAELYRGRRQIPQTKGSGIALLYAKVFVEARGGEIQSDDSPLGGVRTIIRLRALETS